MSHKSSDSEKQLSLTLLQATPPWDWPEGTDELLLRCLNDEELSESERLIAADLAGDFTVINDALAGKLLSIVRDTEESDPLRSMAAISLGPVLEHADIEGFEDVDDIDEMPIREETFNTLRTTLRQVYENRLTPKMVRRRVLEASVRAPEAWHDAATREAAASSDPEWRVTAVFCMGHVQGFEPSIIEALSSPEPEIELEAVRASANWELAAAAPHIMKLITSKGTDKALLLAAIEAAGYICREGAFAVLSDLSDSQDEEIAEAASEALVMPENFGDEEAGDEGTDEYPN